MSKIKYPQDMKDVAKSEGKHLVTIDVPGLTYQGPCSKARVLELYEIIKRWAKENNDE